MILTAFLYTHSKKLAMSLKTKANNDKPRLLCDGQSIWFIYQYSPEPFMRSRGILDGLASILWQASPTISATLSMQCMQCWYAIIALHFMRQCAIFIS